MPGNDPEFKQLLDKQYTRTPFYGVPRMTEFLRNKGHTVGPKLTRRLLREMGLLAVYPKPRTSQPCPTHRIYPYLLRNVEITAPNQVWGTDITYIRLQRGFVYLVAILDWFSRYVVAWELSVTLEVEFCIRALERAFGLGVPQIFNSDQGSQFTSSAFTERLLVAEVQISMDGRGRFYDNIFVERLWRTVKYEEVYLKDYASPRDARLNLERYFEFYNTERLHQSLAYRSPAEVYYGGKRVEV